MSKIVATLGNKLNDMNYFYAGRLKRIERELLSVIS